MTFMIIDLQVDLFLTSAVKRDCHFIPHDFITRRNDVIEIGHRHIHFIMEVTPAVFLPFLLKVAGCNGDLIICGADHHFKHNAVCIISEEGMIKASRVIP